MARRDVEVVGSARRLVRAPLERVYAAWIDPDLMPRWMGGHRITTTGGRLDRPGATFREEIAGPYRPRGQVIAATPPTAHELTGRGIFGLGYRWKTTFTAVPGGSEVQLDGAVILPLHPIGRAMRRLMNPTTVASRLEHRLALFARAVEDDEP